MTQEKLRLTKSSALNSPKAQVGVFIYLGPHFLPHSKQSSSRLQTIDLLKQIINLYFRTVHVVIFILFKPTHALFLNKFTFTFQCESV